MAMWLVQLVNVPVTNTVLPSRVHVKVTMTSELLFVVYE